MKKSGAVFFVLLTAALLFSGCGKAENAPKPEEEIAKADLYGEIIHAPEEGKLTIYFLDLSVKPGASDKSGDATVIILPDGKVMMIDGGHPDSSADSLKFLSDLGIGKIDYFILTHPHIDHIGGFPAIAEKHEIGEVFQVDVRHETNTYRAYLEALETHALPVRNLKRGDELMFGEEVSAFVFNPPEGVVYPPNFPANSTQFLNDNSLVIKFTWGKSSLLMGADIYLTRERDIVDLYGEALHSLAAKANHHGNDTSNSPRWIRSVRPELIVSMDDIMGDMSVYNNYKRGGAAYYHTFLDGIVKVIMDKEGNIGAASRYGSWLRD